VTRSESSGTTHSPQPRTGSSIPSPACLTARVIGNVVDALAIRAITPGDAMRDAATTRARVSVTNLSYLRSLNEEVFRRGL